MARFIITFCVAGLAMLQGGGIRDEDVKVDPAADFLPSEMETPSTEEVKAAPQEEGNDEGSDEDEDKEAEHVGVPELGENAPMEEGVELDAKPQAADSEDFDEEGEDVDENIAPSIDAAADPEHPSLAQLGVPKLGDGNGKVDSKALPGKRLWKLVLNQALKWLEKQRRCLVECGYQADCKCKTGRIHSHCKSPGAKIPGASGIEREPWCKVDESDTKCKDKTAHKPSKPWWAAKYHWSKCACCAGR